MIKYLYQSECVWRWTATKHTNTKADEIQSTSQPDKSLVAFEQNELDKQIAQQAYNNAKIILFEASDNSANVSHTDKRNIWTECVPRPK